MKHSLLLTALLATGTLLPARAMAESESTAQVANAMAGYHFQATPESLESVAGGQDQLVSALLELRTNSSRPFVAVRAERMLLHYADRDDVNKALLSDLSSIERKGLARTITTHIDRAPEKARRVLGQAAVQRAERDPDFGPYARSMTYSADPEIRTMARSLGD